MRGGILVVPVDDDSQRDRRASHATSRSPAPKKDIRSPSARPSKPKAEAYGSPLPPLSPIKKAAHGRSTSETNALSNIDENSTSLYLNPSPHRYFAPQPLTPSFLLESDAADDAQQQAMEILASLTSLGISSHLRQRVQEALSKELDKDAAESTSQDQGGQSLTVDSESRAGPHHPSPSPGVKAKSGTGSNTAASKARELSKEAALKKQMTVEELEKKLTLSRSIMRKLYHKTVHLEKEVQLLKANSKPINDLTNGGPGDDSSSEALRPTTAMSGHSIMSSSSPWVVPSGIGPVAQAIQERDRTISQLQQALDASRRRCTLLESSSSSSSSAASPGSNRQQQAISDLMAQSSLHLGKYKQIRDDYNSLLFKRSGAISSSKLATQAAKDLVEDMQARLTKEIEEREAEAALYSSRLYESERAMADLYIDRKGLQEQVAKLNQDISHRDRLDAEIETCVCTMFERTRLLEEENASLNAKLNNQGGHGKASAPSSEGGQALPASVSAIIARGKEERASNQQGQGQVLSLDDSNANDGVNE